MTLTPQKSWFLRPRFFWARPNAPSERANGFPSAKAKRMDAFDFVFFRALLAILTVFYFLFICIPTQLSPQMAVVDASRDQLKLFPLGHTTLHHTLSRPQFSPIQSFCHSLLVVFVISFSCSSSPSYGSQTHRNLWLQSEGLIRSIVKFTMLPESF